MKIREHLLPTIKRLDTSRMSADAVDDASDSLLESTEQQHDRLQAQLRHDKERARRRKDFKKKQKQNKEKK